jgi:hypothetical protein
VGIGIIENGDGIIARATLSMGDTTVTVRPLEGELPMHRSLFPTECDTSVQVDRATLVRAAKKCQALIKAKGENKSFPAERLGGGEGGGEVAGEPGEMPAVPDLWRRSRTLPLLAFRSDGGVRRASVKITRQCGAWALLPRGSEGRPRTGGGPPPFERERVVTSNRRSRPFRRTALGLAPEEVALGA